VVLEPRATGFVMSGVLATGYTTQEAAPVVVVPTSGAREGKVADTLTLGMTETVLGPTSAWVLQATNMTSWTIPSYGVAADIAPDGGLYGLCEGSPGQMSVDSGMGAESGFGVMCGGLDPGDYQPLPIFTEVTRLDRTSLAKTGFTMLAPAISTPVVLNDDVIVGLPPTGSSDFARPVTIVAYGVNDPSSFVYEGTGYGVSWCAGTSGVGAVGVALAYEPSDAVGSTRLVSAQLGDGWQVHVTTLPDVRPASSTMACSADATHILVPTVDPSGASHVTLIDIPTGLILQQGSGLSGPFAIDAAGTSAIATVATGATLVRLDESGITPLPVAETLPVSPVVNGDLALWALASGFAVVHLDDGTVENPLGPVVDGAAAVAWRAGGGFVVPILETDPANGGPELAQLLVARPGRTASLPLGRVRDNPALVPPVSDTLFVTTESGGDDSADAGLGDPAQVFLPAGGSTVPHLLTYDLGALTLVSETIFPTCDVASTLADAGCSP
jgi:hypothetical protein